MGWQDAPAVDEAPAKPNWASAPEVAPRPEATDNLGVYPVPPPAPTGDSLRASWQSVQPVNPDEQGKVLRIARDTGVPPQVVAADPQGFAQTAPTHLDALPSHAPTLAAHVQDPANMAAAKDDLGRLSTLEWTLTGGLVTGARWDAEPLRYQPPAWFEALRGGIAGLRLGAEKSRLEQGLPASESPYYTAASDSLLKEAATGVLGPFAGIAKAALPAVSPAPSETVIAELRQADERAAARDLYAKTLAARAWVGAFGAAPFLATNAAASAVGGFPAALALNTELVYGENVQQIREVKGPGGEKLSPGAAVGLGAATSLAEGAVYSFGLGKLGKTLAGPVAQRIPGQILERVAASSTVPAALGKLVLRFGAAEAEGAATMAAADALNAASAEYARTRVDLTHDFDTGPIVDRAVQTFEKGLTDFALISAFGAGQRFLRDVGLSRAAAREAQALRDAAAAVKDSKLAERDPGAVEELIGKSSPGQSAFIDREAWDAYWREKKPSIDPRAKAAEIAGDDGRAYDLATGTQFLALPFPQALVRLSKADHWAPLALDTKLSAESRTPREELAFQQQRAQPVQPLERGAEEQPPVAGARPEDFVLWRPSEGPPPIPIVERPPIEPPKPPQGPYSELPSPFVRSLYPELWPAIPKRESDVAQQTAESAARQIEADAGLQAATKNLMAMVGPKDRGEIVKAEAAKYEATVEATRRAIQRDEQGPPENIRKMVRDEVAAEIDAQPVRRLQAYLGREKAPEAGIVEAALGRLDPSLLDEHGQPFRLDRRTLVDDYGPDIVKELPRGATVEKGGVEADFLAERFGYDSASEMIDALRKAGPRDAAVEARLQERIRELYPVVAENPSAVVQAAVDAEHTPLAAEVALEATRVLVREIDPALGARLKVMEDRTIRKATAERLIGGSRIAETQPERFLAAERKYAREALEWTAKALGKGEERAKEYAARAMDARDLQLLNMEMYRASRDAKVEMRKAAAYAQRMTTDEARREIGKATSAETDADGKVWVTQPYLDRMDDLTESIDFRKGAGRARRAERFQTWLEQQMPDTRTDILSRVSASTVAGLDKTRHWADLTVQEMRDLVGAMETIEAQAKLKSKLRTAQGERDKEQFVGRIVAEIRERFPRGGAITRFREDLSFRKRVGQGFKAILGRPAELYRELGPTASEVFRTISDAEVEANRLMREVGAPIVKQIEGLSRSERKLLTQKFIVDGVPMTGERIIGIALNWASGSNRSKMIRGEAALAGRFREARPIPEETLRHALDLLSPKGKELVDTVLRQVGEAKWEDIAALEKEFTGLAPPKVERYFPIVYDPRFSTAGQHAGEQVSQGVGALAFAPNYERAVTPQGHLQARIESFARPLDLSLSAIPRAIVNHMRDLAMRRALVQTREILTDPRVRDAIQEAMGDPVYNTLVDHWRDSANEYAVPRGVPGMLVRWADRRRSAVTAAVFAGNVGQALQNFANIGPALDAVPSPVLAKAFGRFAVKRLEMRDEVFDLSPYMKERFASEQARGAIQRATADLAGKFSGPAQMTERLREIGMWMMETTDMVTAVPVWWAAYEHAQRPKGEGARGLAEAGSRAKGLGMTPEQAVGHADQVVQLTQSSYRWVDKSAFERFVLTRPFSMFYGYMNAQLNRLIAAHADRRLLADQGFQREAMRRIVKTYAFLMASGVAADLLVGKGPQDYDGDGEIDEGDWARWIAIKSVLYAPSTLPVAGGFIDQLQNPGGTVRDPSAIAAYRAATVAVEAGKHAIKAASPEARPDEAYKAGLGALETLGWYYGLPVAQFKRTGDYWFDITPDGQIVESEQAQQETGTAPFLGTAYGPSKPGRLTEAIK